MSKEFCWNKQLLVHTDNYRTNVVWDGHKPWVIQMCQGKVFNT